jgi:glycosyltransferase involved in cell wall biosynthesis
MNIGFIIDAINSPSGGTENQLLALIGGLKKKGFSPHLFLLGGSEWINKSFKHCPCYVLNIEKLLSFRALAGILRLTRLLREKNIMVLQTFFHDANTIGVVAAKLAGVPAIVGSRRNAGYWHDRIQFPLQKFLNRFQSAFIANSEWTKRFVVQSEAIQDAKVEVIHNGIDFSAFKDISSEDVMQVRAALGIACEVPVVGIVANLRPVKRIDVFIKAAELILKDNDSVRFLVVGAGPLETELKAQARELGLSDAVVFTGGRTDIPVLLKAMNVGVLTSDSESFSNSIIEYMYAGLPVVCTEAGGCREAVLEGETGFVVPVGDYMAVAERVNTLLSSERYAPLGKRGREIAMEFFGPERSLDKHCHLYRKLI